MSKRPSLSAETVVRKSRLAAKGEAIPALVHGQHNHHDHPDAGLDAVLVRSVSDISSESVVAPALESAPAPEPAVGATVSMQPVVDRLLNALAERDRQLEQMRMDLLKVEQDRLRERALAAQDHDQSLANLVAADATIDELRNRVSDLRHSLEQSRAEVARLVEQHAAERQALLGAPRHLAVSAEAPASWGGDAPVSQAPVSQAPVSQQAPVLGAPPLAEPLRAGEGGVLQAARRWLFGNEAPNQAVLPGGDQKTAALGRAGAGYQPRSAQPQNPGPTPASARPSVIKPVGPPTAPKVLNRRPVS